MVSGDQSGCAGTYEYLCSCIQYPCLGTGASEGQGKPTQFIPIHFGFTNKLGKNEKLLLAFDAFILSETLGYEISHGKIIHGNDHAILKVKTSAMTDKVWKRVENIVALLSSPSLPDLVLNRHCTECEF